MSCNIPESLAKSVLVRLWIGRERLASQVLDFPPVEFRLAAQLVAIVSCVLPDFQKAWLEGRRNQMMALVQPCRWRHQRRRTEVREHNRLRQYLRWLDSCNIRPDRFDNGAKDLHSSDDGTTDLQLSSWNLLPLHRSSSEPKVVTHLEDQDRPLSLIVRRERNVHDLDLLALRQAPTLLPARDVLTKLRGGPIEALLLIARALSDGRVQALVCLFARDDSLNGVVKTVQSLPGHVAHPPDNCWLQLLCGILRRRREAGDVTEELAQVLAGLDGVQCSLAEVQGVCERSGGRV